MFHDLGGDFQAFAIHGKQRHVKKFKTQKKKVNQFSRIANVKKRRKKKGNPLNYSNGYLRCHVHVSMHYPGWFVLEQDTESVQESDFHIARRGRENRVAGDILSGINKVSLYFYESCPGLLLWQLVFSLSCNGMCAQPLPLLPNKSPASSKPPDINAFISSFPFFLLCCRPFHLTVVRRSLASTYLWRMSNNGSVRRARPTYSVKSRSVIQALWTRAEKQRHFFVPATVFWRVFFRLMA